jgi:hypothetical protein
LADRFLLQLAYFLLGRFRMWLAEMTITGASPIKTQGFKSSGCCGALYRIAITAQCRLGHLGAELWRSRPLAMIAFFSRRTYSGARLRIMPIIKPRFLPTARSIPADASLRAKSFLQCQTLIERADEEDFMIEDRWHTNCAFACTGSNMMSSQPRVELNTDADIAMTPRTDASLVVEPINDALS